MSRCGKMCKFERFSAKNQTFYSKHYLSIISNSIIIYKDKKLKKGYCMKKLIMLSFFALAPHLHAYDKDALAKIREYSGQYREQVRLGYLDSKVAALLNETFPLQNADLSGAPLSNLTLAGADLTGANLQNADLSNADITYALFDSANLSNANLKNCTLYSYVPEGTNTLRGFKNTNLTNANLTYAILYQTDLSSATLTGAIFKNTTYDQFTTFPEGFDPKQHPDLKYKPLPEFNV